MPPKGKGGDKDKSKAKDAGEAKGGKTKGAQSINVRHVLCEKHAKKEEALAKLNAGSKFDEVAREFSEDKARQGGSLGWKTKGALMPEFEAVAFELAASTTNSPKWGECKTSEGYHIIMVEGRR
ncbi:Peptidyl-prolyl cis-trans isomerase pin4 [Recurvomyces mirabilis]|uniref:Peptidyl-prolyl cis-trans isomerase n=1 Tax=Recurvomyces mirabilis TaxID=574656 RepID=A0AAE1C1I7_9PEZI|nr:Peptidyl-prolyl cis-trans isomerase pin4 [Recurvomyces mirabilis]KAK5152748.1 Peptidyl-prolyl cis-trans isomerase pin4 [Recurvomyces mirabilis]